MWTPENRGLYARPGLRYPSDLTDAEWDLVRPFLRRRTRSGPAPERLREILNAVPPCCMDERVGNPGWIS